MITIKEAVTKKELKDFIKFSFDLYKGNPYWIPPIINDELETFDKQKNPVFEHADAHFYLAYRNGKIVGKVAAIINWEEVNNQQKKKVRFGWFDVIDDIEVTKALLEKVYEFGRTKGLEYVEGPIGFSNLDKVGALTHGFDHIGTMVTWYNYPYYADHFEKLGFTPEKGYLESYFPFDNIVPDYFYKGSAIVQKRYGLKLLSFTSTKQVMRYVDEMFDVFNKSYEGLSSFVAVSEVQKEYYKKKYISLINPEYILFVMDKDDKMVAFSIVMPSFSEALQKANGKMFPFGFLHMLNARKHSKDIVFYLIGITPEYRSKGVTAMIFEGHYNYFKDKGMRNCIRTPELEENHAIHNLWKHFNPTIHKRRKTFRRDI